MCNDNKTEPHLQTNIAQINDESMNTTSRAQIHKSIPK